VTRALPLLAALALAACASSSERTDITTTMVDPRIRDLQVAAVEKIADSFDGTDVDCDRPTSVDVGTTFACTAELNGQTLGFHATVGPGGDITLVME
jgi:hypothetical protein